jgi:hypothetical protein
MEGYAGCRAVDWGNRPARSASRRRRCLRGFEHEKADLLVGVFSAGFAFGERGWMLRKFSPPSKTTPSETFHGEDSSLSSLF